MSALFRRSSCLAVLLLAASTTLSAASFAQVCVEGTSIAEYQIGGPYAGMWKYTLEVSWETGSYGLSHLTFDLELDDCPCICDGIILFDTPAGQSDGEPEPCTVDYAGDFVCQGDPSIPGQTGAAVKWNAIDGVCEPGASGSGTFWFYSLLGPGAPGEIGELWIKFGQLNCTGALTGEMPVCDGCPTPVESSSWGAIKALY